MNLIFQSRNGPVPRALSLKAGVQGSDMERKSSARLFAALRLSQNGSHAL